MKYCVVVLAATVLALSLSGQAEADTSTEVDFTEGTAGALIRDFYDGVSFPNFRFFNWSGNPGDDFPFTDFWGATIDSGLSPDLVGRISFPSPVDSVEFDGVINNSDFSTDVEWNATAFDSNGNQVDFVSSGLFDPADQNGALHIFSTLSLDAPGTISNIRIDQQIELGRHKGWGLDTVRFEKESAGPTSVIPEPSSLLLMGAGLLGLVMVQRKLLV
jgi:hypothetical protein